MQRKYIALAFAAVALAGGACSKKSSTADDKTAAAAEQTVAQAEKSPGEKLFLQCRACHTIKAGDRNGIGPNLNGVVGAKAAAHPDYTYSPALAASGIIWTPEKLDAFLVKPNAVVPGTKMSFGGMTYAQARADLIAYLSSVPTK